MTHTPPAHDSRAETLAHIHRVRDVIGAFIAVMLARGAAHDASKLVEPEKSGFDRVLPLLRGLSYGSAEYRALEAAEAGLVALHHANNSHHPEHYGNRGIAGMDLFDLVEMLCDWIAAAERHPADGVRLDINVERHGIEPQLASILANTLARWPGTSGRALPGTP